MKMPRISRRDCLLGLAALPASAWAAEKQSGAPHVHDNIRRWAEQAPLTMKFRGESERDARLWQNRFRAQLGTMLGNYLPPREYRTVVEDSVEFPEYTRLSLLLEADGVATLPVYLLTPKGAASEKRPAVLALHGHGPFGHDPVVGIEDTAERAENIKNANYDYGRRLVKQGYVVAAPCFTPFGRRLDDPEAYRRDDACGVSFVRMQMLGRVLMAENLRDAIWSVDLLTRQNEVDPERIGCVGLSYGGRMTMLTAAMDPRIRVAVCSGALNMLQERISGRYSCGAQVIPGLLQYGDVPEIASLIAPRPCLWEVGNQDGLMVKEWIGPAWERMSRVWNAMGAEDSLIMDRFEGGHRWNGVNAEPLLEKSLAATGEGA